ncbi:hypothetical protein I5P92_08745 [Serratia ureilytica]|uniref:hypothetical protein n=1 Tax=Serratia TaxID=613 RepID=UPI001875B178|nr:MULTISPECIES: hypothetical protein [Serratia]MBE4973210.1 hypothetical protein [Serratia sp. X3]MBH3155864.1 hypothetical protein [Serratia ureilytica]MBH3250954.1 hypothetical protein [Serratia ureilytica]
MEHLIHTLLTNSKGGLLVKYEIYSTSRTLNYYNKVPEGTCRVIAYRLDISDSSFKVIDSDLDIQSLFEANRPKENTWYSDGQDRVNLEMVINHLKDMN